MICQVCGLEAPTKKVEFHENIGLVVMRLHKSVQGNLCKSCIRSTFWRMTLTNLFLGWWGLISLVVTPIFIINNVVRYLASTSLAPVPPDATPPVLTDEAIRKLEPCAHSILDGLKHGENLESMAQTLALRTGVTPGQVVLFVAAMINEAERQDEQPAAAT